MKLKFIAASFAVAAATVAAAQAETISVNGVTRSYILDAARGAGPRPLIVALHGGGGSAPEFERDSGLSPIANAVGVTVVYPESLTRQWNDGRAHGRNPRVDEADDVGFMQALVNDLVSKGVADPNHITFTGISNGGMMSFAMACRTSLPIYAIAPVSANVDVGQDCSSTHARLLNIVGTADRAVPMAGGPVLYGWGQGEVQSAQASFGMFLKAERCTGTKSISLPDAADDGMTSVANIGSGCAQSPVAQIVVQGGGHAWAGGRARLKRLLGEPTQDFSASQLVVRLASGENPF
jgi:polyhydroxybutyrate depolymerase